MSDGRPCPVTPKRPGKTAGHGPTGRNAPPAPYGPRPRIHLRRRRAGSPPAKRLPRAMFPPAPTALRHRDRSTGPCATTPADAMASLDACVPQPGHKVKMHAWMAAARWPLGMPGTRNVPPAPPLSAPTGKIRPFPAAGAKKGVRRCAAPFLCAMETKEFQRFGIHAPKWSAFKPAPTGRCARFSEVRVGRGHASSCPVFLA